MTSLLPRAILNPLTAGGGMRIGLVKTLPPSGQMENSAGAECNFWCEDFLILLRTVSAFLKTFHRISSLLPPFTLPMTAQASVAKRHKTEPRQNTSLTQKLSRVHHP